MNLTAFSLPVLLIAFAGMRLAPSAKTIIAPDAASSRLVTAEKPSVTAVRATAATMREESAELIPWSARRIVGWEDFQSAPVHGTEAVASTSTSLGLSYQLKDGELSYNITCNFQKTKSWGLMKTEYILAHEQGHFDITELMARKLYQALSTYPFDRRNFKQDLTRIYNDIVAEKESLQNTYDRETDHSRNRRVQSEWLARINEQLEATQAYATYP
ncbi:DUF922 domain-containing protein [Flaviaesturariibacter terrae]